MKTSLTLPGVKGDEKRGFPKRTGIRGFPSLLKESFKRWREDRASRLGAALSYYTAFSLAPMLLLAIAVAGFVFGREAAQGQIVAELTGLVGRPAAKTIQNMISAAQKPMAGAVSAIIGVISLLLGASGAMTEMKDAVNRIWRVQVARGVGFFLRTRLKAMGMVLVIGFLLLVSLAVSATLSALGVYLGKGAVGSSYGAAGAVLIILCWVYYSAQIFYFGAEFTKIYADRSKGAAPAA